MFLFLFTPSPPPIFTTEFKLVYLQSSQVVPLSPSTCNASTTQNISEFLCLGIAFRKVYKSALLFCCHIFSLEETGISQCGSNHVRQMWLWITFSYFQKSHPFWMQGDWPPRESSTRMCSEHHYKMCAAFRIMTFRRTHQSIPSHSSGLENQPLTYSFLSFIGPVLDILSDVVTLSLVNFAIRNQSVPLPPVLRIMHKVQNLNGLQEDN